MGHIILRSYRFMKFIVLFYILACMGTSCLTLPHAFAKDGSNDAIHSTRITADIFGRRSRHIHPFLSLSSLYSDNLYRTVEDKKEGWGLLAMPAIWISLPGLKTDLDPMGISPTTTGGMMYRPYDDPDSRRFLFYLNGRMGVERYADHSEENTTTGAVETRLIYRMRNGAAFTINGQQNRSHDKRGESLSTRLEKYTSNYLKTQMTYSPHGKLSLAAGLSLFDVDYDSSAYRFRDRTDTTFSLDIGYPILPKTRLFLEYTRFNIDYREQAMEQVREDQYNLGLSWYISAKSRGVVKAGYGIRTFDKSDESSNEDYILEARINYKVSGDTSVSFTTYKQYQETRIPNTDYIDTLGCTATCLYQLTSKIFLDLKLDYTADDFFGDGKRTGDEKTFAVSPSAGYQMGKWLTFKLEYTFEQRSSSYSTDSRDANTNTIVFNVTAGV